MKRGTKGDKGITALLLLTVLWLVMQVFVPVYHHHTHPCRASDSPQAYWQNNQHDEHDCHICSLHYSPSSPDVQVTDVVIPEYTDAPCSRDTLLTPLRVVSNPSERAPPTA
jgi:hypothetical protein